MHAFTICHYGPLLYVVCSFRSQWLCLKSPAHKRRRCWVGARGGAVAAALPCSAPAPAQEQGKPWAAWSQGREERNIKSLLWQRCEGEAASSQSIRLLFFCQRGAEQSTAALRLQSRAKACNLAPQLCFPRGCSPCCALVLSGSICLEKEPSPPFLHCSTCRRISTRLSANPISISSVPTPCSLLKQQPAGDVLLRQ